MGTIIVSVGDRAGDPDILHWVMEGERAGGQWEGRGDCSEPTRDIAGPRDY